MVVFLKFLSVSLLQASYGFAVLWLNMSWTFVDLRNVFYTRLMKYLENIYATLEKIFWKFFWHFRIWEPIFQLGFEKRAKLCQGGGKG